MLPIQYNKEKYTFDLQEAIHSKKQYVNSLNEAILLTTLDSWSTSRHHNTDSVRQSIINCFDKGANLDKFRAYCDKPDEQCPDYLEAISLKLPIHSDHSLSAIKKLLPNLTMLQFNNITLLYPNTTQKSPQQLTISFPCLANSHYNLSLEWKSKI